MALFRCESCGCYENTALSNWALRFLRKQPNGATPPPLCSECDPEIGKWHGQFPKLTADGLFVGDGNLYHPEEVAEGTYGRSREVHGRIVNGVVVPMTPQECKRTAEQEVKDPR